MRKAAKETIDDIRLRITLLGRDYVALKQRHTKAVAENHVLRNYLASQGIDPDNVINGSVRDD